MSDICIPLDVANRLTDIAFVESFGDVAEHSPWVAEYALGIRPFLNREAMITAFRDGLYQARRDAQTDLIRAHPDLAGKAALAGEVTDDSKNEQAGVGLDRLSPAEFKRFNELNDRYKEKFGFPFIFAVKGATKDMILEAFVNRLEHSFQKEFDTALGQIARIFRFRIEDRICPDKDNGSENMVSRA